jgi:hypothetical protein
VRRQVHSVDSGFIVHNERTYPTLRRLFRELGVATQETEMSMSVSCRGCGLEYAGGRGAAGLFAHRSSAANPRFLSMLAQVPAFHRRARALLRKGSTQRQPTLGEFLADGQYSRYFVRHFANPLVSAVWSCGPHRVADYPARYLFEFLANHGMLSLKGSAAWKTVVGGSRSYVDKLAKRLTAVRVFTPVRAVVRHADGVVVQDDSGSAETFDEVVVATHPDQALRLLAQPTAQERAVLGAFEYSENETLLHTDAGLLPAAGAARASWNYLLPQCAPEPGGVRVSYHLNTLQRLRSDTDFVVTLGRTERGGAGARVGPHELSPSDLHAGGARGAAASAHPVHGPHRLRGRLSRLGLSRGRLPIRRPRSAIARSAMVKAALYESVVRHQRSTPIRYGLRHRTYFWLVDLDQLPRLPRPLRPLAQFLARDHLGDPALSIRDNVLALMRSNGVPTAGGADHDAHAGSRAGLRIQSDHRLLVPRHGG